MVGARPEVDKHPGEGTVQRLAVDIVQRLVVDIVQHPEDMHPGVDSLPVEADTVPGEVDIVLVEVDNLLKIKVLLPVVYGSLGRFRK